MKYGGIKKERKKGSTVRGEKAFVKNKNNGYVMNWAALRTIVFLWPATSRLYIYIYIYGDIWLTVGVIV